MTTVLVLLETGAEGEEGQESRVQEMTGGTWAENGGLETPGQEMTGGLETPGPRRHLE